MKIDSHHFTAANDNDHGRPVQQQLELDLQPACDKVTEPGRTQTPPPPKPRSVRPPKPTKAPRKAGTCADQAPAQADQPAPARISGNATAPTADADGAIISLKRERISRDQRLGEMNELADQSMKFARDRVTYVHIADTPQEEDAYFRQWALAVATYARVMATTDKHTQFLSEQD